MFRRILDVDEVPPKNIIHKTQIIWGYMGYDSNFDLLLASLQSTVMGLLLPVVINPQPSLDFVRSIATIHAGVYDLDNDFFRCFSLRSKWKHYKIQPKENGPKPKHRSFVPAVEFIAYSLENWDEILGKMVFDETGRWCRKPTGEASMACWKVLRLLGLISCCSLGKMCQTACFKHSAGVFRY